MVAGANLHHTHRLYVYKGLFFCWDCGGTTNGNNPIISRLHMPCDGMILDNGRLATGRLAQLKRIKKGLVPYKALKQWPSDARSWPLDWEAPKGVKPYDPSRPPTLAYRGRGQYIGSTDEDHAREHARRVHLYGAPLDPAAAIAHSDCHCLWRSVGVPLRGAAWTSAAVCGRTALVRRQSRVCMGAFCLDPEVEA